ncbi:MAG: hypothetical protein WCH98_03800 [Verrucomicrobiota bacterium]
MVLLETFPNGFQFEHGMEISRAAHGAFCLDQRIERENLRRSSLRFSMEVPGGHQGGRNLECCLVLIQPLLPRQPQVVFKQREIDPKCFRAN